MTNIEKPTNGESVVPTDLTKPTEPVDFDNIYRLHPRTFPYQELLPYKTETQKDALAHLDHIVTNIYIVLESWDKDHAVASTINSTVLHWTRELNSWMQLKFDMPLSTRVKLARLYYELALADVEGTTLERIANTFVWLCDNETFIRYVKPSDIKLRAEPLMMAIKDRFIPGESNPLKLSLSKSTSALFRVAGMARSFYDYNETKELYNQILPLVSVQHSYKNSQFNPTLTFAPFSFF